MALRWSDSSISDLEPIQEYNTRDSTKQAQRVVGALFRAAEGLVTLPFVGQANMDVEGERERPLSRWGYVLIYRVIADGRSHGGEADIEIVRVLGPGQQRS
ncbi:MAG TPA: type II toxin-antitoxin system RelE/ParE family toxin [Chloroflexota bacterium]